MSKIPFVPMSSKPAQQQGAVLIVVLLFLVLIIIAGAIAVRQSTTDLKLSTSDQIDTLLLQSADNANQNIEQSINGDSNNTTYRDMLSISGPFGYFILNEKGRDNEYVFCFRPRDRFFNINKTSITTPDGDTILPNSTGYCNPAVRDDYVSKRGASMAQVSISMTPPQTGQEAFSNYTVGQDVDKVSSLAFTFDLNSTALLPAYGSTEIETETEGEDSESSSKNCLAQTSRPSSSANTTDTISGCLAAAGVPSTTVYQQVDIENQSLRTKCVEFGVGSGKIDDDNVLCQLIPN